MKVGRHIERGIRAILVVDLVESVRLIGKDEEGVVSRWLELVEHVETQVLFGSGGQLVKSLGDGMLLEFLDAVSATSAAFSIQRACHRMNEGLAPEQHMFLRMGIEVSNVIVDRHDVYGMGVNLAALLTSLAGPGEIVISARVRDQLVATLDADIEDLGECYLKHVPQPVRAYRIRPPGPRPAVAAPQMARLIADELAKGNRSTGRQIVQSFASRQESVRPLPHPTPERGGWGAHQDTAHLADAAFLQMIALE